MSKTLLTPKGELTLPIEIREKYGYNDWMLLSVVDMEDGSILLKPVESKLDGITKDIQKKLEEDGVTFEDLTITLREVRKELFQEKYGDILSKKQK